MYTQRSCKGEVYDESNSFQNSTWSQVSSERSFHFSSFIEGYKSLDGFDFHWLFVIWKSFETIVSENVRLGIWSPLDLGNMAMRSFTGGQDPACSSKIGSRALTLHKNGSKLKSFPTLCFSAKTILCLFHLLYNHTFIVPITLLWNSINSVTLIVEFLDSII